MTESLHEGLRDGSIIATAVTSSDLFAAVVSAGSVSASN